MHAHVQNRRFPLEGGMNTMILNPQPVSVDGHYSPQFYAELWGVSVSTVIRWFQDEEGVLKLDRPRKNGQRGRTELRIPFSLAMRVYAERCKRKG